MPADANSEQADAATDEQPADQPTDAGSDGDVDYAKLTAEFGAEPITDEQRDRFPDPVHPMVRRSVFFAGRDLDEFLAAAARGDRVSVVTGVGPSGPMHLGHALVFYFARYLQKRTGAHVSVPLSDDEKYLTRDQTLAEGRAYTRENLRDLLAVGFDPERTRVVVDTMDADVVYPLATSFAKHLTPAQVAATYGDPANVGQGFYPAVQTAHLLLPNLVDGRHPTLVPIAADQDPHVRVARDVAAKARYDVEKPGALLSRFLPSLDGPGKMSSSDDAPAIALTDDRDTVFETIRTHAYSGGRTSVAEHREKGGDPDVDVSFQYLRAFFEPDDDRLAGIEQRYRAGELLSGELKEIAAERVADFLDAHRERRAALGDLDDELAPYRLTDDERERALASVGLA
jgi:tryptophanyl-tRNA synthetase